MKIFIITIIVVLSVSVKVKAQELIVSSMKIGDLKIFAPLDSINKYLDTKIYLKPYLKKDHWEYDTVSCIYKNTRVKLIFLNQCDSYTNKQDIRLNGYYSDDVNIKTKSGIKLGDNKFDIIRKLDGNELEIHPDEGKGAGYSKVELIDSHCNVLTFHFKDNILYAIECEIMEEDFC